MGGRTGLRMYIYQWSDKSQRLNRPAAGARHKAQCHKIVSVIGVELYTLPNSHVEVPNPRTSEDTVLSQR